MTVISVIFVAINLAFGKTENRKTGSFLEQQSRVFMFFQLFIRQRIILFCCVFVDFSHRCFTLKAWVGFHRKICFRCCGKVAEFRRTSSQGTNRVRFGSKNKNSLFIFIFLFPLPNKDRFKIPMVEYSPNNIVLFIPFGLSNPLLYLLSASNSCKKSWLCERRNGSGLN